MPKEQLPWNKGQTIHERGSQAIAEKERKAAPGVAKKQPTTTTTSSSSTKSGTGTPASGFSEHFSQSDMNEYMRNKKP